MFAHSQEGCKRGSIEDFPSWQTAPRTPQPKLPNTGSVALQRGTGVSPSRGQSVSA